MKVLVLILITLLTACSTQVQLPSNASVTQSGSARYLDRIDYSYEAESAPDFSTIQLCIADSINNDDVLVKDSSGSWVGPYTGNYYRNDNRQRISGRGLFKYVSEKKASLIANGASSYMGGGLIPVKQFLRFDIRASVKGQNVNLVFSNIRRAQQDTGTLANNGFAPVGAWTGADTMGAYNQLDLVGKSLQSCISSWN